MRAVATGALSFTHEGAATPAVKGIDFAQDEGEHTVLLGASGAGRSTFLHCVSRAAPKYFPGTLEGSISLFGEDVTARSTAEVAGRLALVFEDFESQLFCATVESETAFGPESLALEPEEVRRRVAWALEMVGLRGLERRPPWTLSGGQKQRLAIAAAVAMKPSLLLLDEVTSQLDPRGARDIVETLARLRGGLTLLSAETEPRLAADAARVVLMKDGRIEKSGPPEEVLKDVSLLRACGVEPPETCLLFEALGEAERPLVAEDAVEILLRKGYVAAPVVEDERESEGAVLAETNELTHVYPGGVEALRGVSVRFRAGELLAVVGENGSGKTTLAKHLNGLLAPTGGQVTVKGVPTRDYRGNSLQRVCAYLFQNPDEQIFARSVAEEVAFGLRNFGFRGERLRAGVEESLERVGLLAEADSDPRFLSLDRKQRLAVASVTAYEPEILILDEPTTGLDAEGGRRVMELALAARARGACVVLITHSMRLVAGHCDRALALKDGKVAFDGAPRRLFSERGLLDELHLAPPDLVRVGWGFDTVFLSVAEAAGRLRKRRAGECGTPST